MYLAKLFQGFNIGAIPIDFQNIDILAVCADSRKVIPNSLFVAVHGAGGNGMEYIPQAIAQGARVIVQPGPQFKVNQKGETLVVSAPDPQDFLRGLVRNFYGDVSRKVRTIGITGTNGKTTITYLLESILLHAGKSCGVIGTVNYRYAGQVFPAKNTTPGIIDNHFYLQKMWEAGCLYCAMEVSSHALVQGRVGGIDFRSAVFTNLTSDHLDYHQNREDYFLAKSLLFTGLSDHALALVNVDDSFGSRLLQMSRGRKKTYGIRCRADFMAQEIKLSPSGTSFLWRTPRGNTEIQTSLIGIHNVYNILAAAGVAWDEGLAADQIKAGIERLRNVPGRLERVEAGQAFTVLIDYAHTEDALKNVLTSIRQVRSGKIILVFGCGGDRDRSKRPKMGQVADALADFSIITTDNPRSEDPEAIAAEVLAGFRGTNVRTILERKRAIRAALAMAREKDVVLIAGKGHEDYQIFKDRTIPFDEKSIVLECLNGITSKDS